MSLTEILKGPIVSQCLEKLHDPIWTNSKYLYILCLMCLDLSLDGFSCVNDQYGV